MNAVQNQMIPTRRSLIGRLVNWDDQESWRDFFETYQKLIYGAALKAGLSHAAAQDIVQEVLISVARKIREFRYDPKIGSFKGWLLHITRCRIADQIRKQRRQPKVEWPISDEAQRTPAASRVPDPAGLSLERVWDDEWERCLMDAAIRRVKRQVSPRQYQIFDLYILKQWPVTKVARILGVNVGQVYLVKHRVSALLRREVKHLEKSLI